MRVLMISKACIVGIYQPKLEHIARAGVTLRVIVPPSWRDERGEQMLERVYTQGYELCVAPMMLNGNFHLHFYQGLGAHFDEFKPDIVHIDEEPYNLATWQALYHARRVGAKVLFFSWQNITRHYPPPFRWGEAWVLRHTDYALMGTQSALDVWREKGYVGSASVLPQFGTDLSLFQPRPRPERPFTVGFIGRMIEEKGVSDLLQAMTRIKGDWRLRLVGGGTHLEQFRAQVQALGMEERVTFIPQMPSTAIPAEYQALDVLILPSRTRPNWKEQFGRVLIEAMASGVPVIGSDSGAIPSVIGDAGLIFREGDADHLAQHIQAMMQADTHADYRTRGLGRAQTFTHEAIAQATVTVYEALMAGAS